MTSVRAPIIAPGTPKSPPSAPGPALSEEPESHPPCYSGTFSNKWGPSASHSPAWLLARAPPAPEKRAAALAQRHPEDLAMPGSPRALQQGQHPGWEPGPRRAQLCAVFARKRVRGAPPYPVQQGGSSAPNSRGFHHGIEELKESQLAVIGRPPAL